MSVCEIRGASLRSHQPQGLTEKGPEGEAERRPCSPEPHAWYEISFNWNVGFGPYPKMSRPFPEGLTGAARLRAESVLNWERNVEATIERRRVR